MDLPVDAIGESGTSSTPLTPELEAATAPFVDRWGRLISQTNWEKGRIIFEWRRALADSGAAASAYADEVWSRRVGGVTPQHVGRLRRVYQRFGEVKDQYPGIFWSHFQVALDWEDAEMWLEGAVQNGWSVAKMRTIRAETLGLSQQEALVPVAVEVDLDEDFRPAETDEPTTDAASAQAARAAADAPHPPTASNGDETVEPPGDGGHRDSGGSVEVEASDVPQSPSEPAATRPFADLPDLPEDLQEALETFKLALLRHKTAGWTDVRPDDVLAALDSLKSLVTAP